MQVQRRIGILCIILVQSMVQAGTQPVVAHYKIRSQGFNGARDAVGVTHHEMQPDKDTWSFNVAVTPFYNQSFKSSRIAHCLFGEDLQECDSIKIEGLRFNGNTVRDPKAWLADYFYLPTDYESFISFKPKIKNAGVDLYAWFGFDQWVPGLYIDVHIPVVHSRWDLGFKEKIKNRGNTNYAPGYFTPGVANRSQMVSSFEAYVRGEAITTLTQDAVQTDPPGTIDPITIQFQALKYAKICKKEKTKTGIADMHIALGWNWLDEDWHTGLSLHVIAPTGNEPSPEFVFDAVVGNEKHWGLGGAINGHYTFWNDEEKDHSCGLYLNARVVHLFDKHVKRTFDLKGKPVSRYMLAQKLGTPIEDGLQGTPMAGNAAGTTPSAQFKNEYAPVANLTTIDVKVGINVEAEIVAMFNWQMNRWNIDLGYNFWVQSCEKIKKGKCPSPLADGKTWALKGDAHVFGYASAATPPIVALQAVALSATQNNATINNGLEKIPNQFHSNVQADGSQFATTLGNIGPDRVALNLAPNAAQTKTSIDPVFITEDNIDFEQRTKGMSHKLFIHANYVFDCYEWQPYIGFGGEIEFGGNESSKSCKTNNSSCPQCQKCALSQWGIWLKGGFSYN